VTTLIMPRPSHLVLSIALSMLIVLAGARACLGEEASDRRFAEARSEFLRGHFAQAAQDLKAFLEASPGSADAEEATFLLAESYRHTGDFALAEVEYRQLITTYPASAHRAEAEFQMGVVLWRESHGAPYDQDLTHRALDQFRRFVTTHPDDPHVQEAKAVIAQAEARLAEKLYRIGRLYVKLRAYESARIYLNDLVSTYPNTLWADRGALLLAESLERENRLGEALEAYTAASKSVHDPGVQREVEKKLSRLQRRLSKDAASALSR
jgi:outer membrane assembly lipoprotein YfiO